MPCLRYFWTILMLTTKIGCLGQSTFSYPHLKPQGKYLSDFVPEGWEIIDSTADYYNFDSAYTTYAIILQAHDSAVIEIHCDETTEILNRNPRILAILFYYRDQRVFELKEQNNQFILPKNPGEHSDSFQSIKFDLGILHIDFTLHYGHAYNEIEYIFRYQAGQFVLIGANTNYSNPATLEYRVVSYNFLTKKWWITQGDLKSSASMKKEKWHPIKFQGLRPLRAFQGVNVWKLAEDQWL
jgi:hypothetical protein